RSHQADVRLQHDQPSIALQYGPDLGELRDDVIRAAQVLEVVAHEDGVEEALRDRRAQRQAVRLHEVHVRTEIRGDLADVGGPAFAGLDVPDEVAPVAGDVEHPAVAGDPTLEEPRDLLPESVLDPRILLPEPMPVDPVEIAVGHGWPGLKRATTRARRGSRGSPRRASHRASWSPRSRGPRAPCVRR